MHVLQVHTTANNHTAVLSCACVVPKISHRYFTFLMLTHSPPRARSTHPAAPSTRHHSRKPAARAARRSASWRCSCGRRRPPAAPPSAARGTPTVSGVHSQWGPQSAGAREHLSRAHGQRGGAAARRRGGAAARRRGGVAATATGSWDATKATAPCLCPCPCPCGVCGVHAVVRATRRRTSQLLAALCAGAWLMKRMRLPPSLAETPSSPDRGWGSGWGESDHWCQGEGGRERGSGSRSTCRVGEGGPSLSAQLTARIRVAHDVRVGAAVRLGPAPHGAHVLTDLPR